MKILRLLITVMFSVVMVASSAYAQLKVDVTRGSVDPLPLAIPDFVPAVDIETATGSLSVSLPACNTNESVSFLYVPEVK